ncbi:MAG: thioredoxin family protein [bacterium]
MKKIFYVAAIVLIVFVSSYLIAQRGAESGRTYPAAPAIEQNAQQSVPEAQEKTNKNTAGIKVTFVELGSVGCTPCDMMRPILDEIEKEYEGQVLVRFYDVRSLFGRPYAEKYNVRMIPTQVFLDNNGEEYYRHVGFFPKEEIVKILQLRGVK